MTGKKKRYLSCEIFTARSSLVNIYEPVSVKVSVCAMTTHPSHTGSENRIGIMWTVAVVRDALVLGEDGAVGPHKLHSEGSLCVYSTLPLGLQTCSEQGKTKPVTKLRTGLLE